MHHKTIEANVPLSVAVCMPEMEAGGHNLEEGDQLVLLNAFDVMYKNPNATLDVFSVDTDVFVLLTGHCEASQVHYSHQKERCKNINL